MAVIQINNLEVLGSDLFKDCETFMNDISEHDISSINGGAKKATPTITIAWFVGGGVVGASLSFGATYAAEQMGW